MSRLEFSIGFEVPGFFCSKGKFNFLPNFLSDVEMLGILGMLG